MESFTSKKRTFQIFLILLILLLAIGTGINSIQAQTFTASGLPQPIPDGLSSSCWVSPGLPITSTIQITGVPGNIVSLEQIQINIGLSHTWAGDVSLSITPPGAAPITLISRLGSGFCGSGFSFSSTNTLSFKGTNSNAIALVNPIPTGNYLPTAGSSGTLDGSLNDLIGLPFNGDWVLTVIDGSAADLGALHHFSIDITCHLANGGSLPSGSGTAPDPYLIATFDNLQWIAQNPGSWDKHFKQTADIDASITSDACFNYGSGWSPIGILGQPFQGTYDGDYHTISNLFINKPSQSRVGFFGATGSNAQINRLSLINAQVTGGNRTGLMVGDLRGTVFQSSASGTVNGGDFTGGFAGIIESGLPVSQCFANATVTATGSAGGFSGYAHAMFSDCYAVGTLNINGNQSGGFLGAIFDGEVVRSYAAMNANVISSGWTGGFVAALVGPPSVFADNFFDIDIFSPTVSFGATPKITQDMTTQSTFTSAGWDFTLPIWKMITANNSGYPYLNWQKMKNINLLNIPDGSIVYDEFSEWNGSEIEWRIVHKNYPGLSNSVTLRSISSVHSMHFNNLWDNRYTNSPLRGWLTDTFEPSFSNAFISTSLVTEVPWMINNPVSGTPSGTVNDRFFIPSQTELGGATSAGDGSVFDYFSDPATATARRDGPNNYWTRTGQQAIWSGNPYDLAANAISTNGTIVSLWVSEIQNIVPAVNISENAIFSLQSDSRYKLLTQTVQYSPTVGGSIFGESSQYVAHGFGGKQVTAQAWPGYFFTSWNDGNTNPTRQELNVISDLNYTANFEQCINPTSGGSITGDQVICINDSPLILNNNLLPTGFNGILEYKWQFTTSNPSAGGFDPASWTDIASSNNATYQPGAITQTTWYRRLAGVTCETERLASNVVMIEVRLYQITASGGEIIIDDACGRGETLDVYGAADDIVFDVSGQYYSLNGGAPQAFPASLLLSGVTQITVNTGLGNDIINVGGFANPMPNFTINGGQGDDVVNFVGDITFAPGANLDVDLQNDHTSPGEDIVNIDANTNLIFHGNGSPLFKMGRWMIVNAGARIEVVNGNLVIEANQQTPTTIGNFIGLINIGTLRTTGEGDIFVKGTGGKNASGNYAGIYMYANGLIQSTGTVTGKGRIFIDGKMEDGFSPYGSGIYLTDNATISSAGGAIEVTGITGNSTSSSTNGITLYGNSAIIGTGSASISVHSNTGNALNGINYSFDMRSAGGRITTVDGDINITASAGTGSASSGILSNVGLFMNNGSFIETTGNGNINIAATTAKVFDAGSGGQAVRLDAPSVIRSANGNISIVANNLNDESGTSFNHGISLRGNISSSGSGNIMLEGTAGIPNVVFANGSQGVQVRNGATVSSAGGNVTIRGTAANTPGNEAVTIARVGNGTVSIGDPSKSITFESNNIDIHPTNGTVNAGSGTVVFKGRTAGHALDLGGADAAGILGLSDAELDRVTAGSLIIGGPASGNITVSADITRPASTNMQLLSNGSVIFTGGGINTNDGTLLLDPGDSPAAVFPDFNGTDVTASTLSFGSDLGIIINGNTPGNGTGATYTQLTVLGGLDLTGVNLVLSGTHSPLATDSYTIVNNLGTLPVTGTFTGLPEGTFINNILGSGFSALITYTGGDGNDVVLNLCLNPGSGGSIADNQTICYNSQPSAFSSITLPGVHAGTLEYKWQLTTTDPAGSVFDPASWIDIASSNAATYQATSLNQTTWFRRLARVDCSTGWNGAAASNVIQITVRPQFTSGSIATAGESICFAGTPSVIGSQVDASGGDLNISYSWRSSADNFTAAISGANAATYFPPAGLTTTTTYRRYANDGTCNTSAEQSAGEWTVTVEPIPVAGSFINSHTVFSTLCEATPVSAVLTGSSGGNGIDQTEYRVFYSTYYTEWMAYNGQVLSIPGALHIEIRSRRLADWCVYSEWIHSGWSFELIPSAGTLTKYPAAAKVCEGTQVWADLSNAFGGNSTDEMHYRKLSGSGWSNWLPYDGSALSTTGSTGIEIRSRRLATYCASTAWITVGWEVETAPMAGILQPSPAQPMVCESSAIAATLLAGLGGSGLDVSEYRTHNGTSWTSWMLYTPGNPIAAVGLSHVEIRTFRQGDVCSNSGYNTISWNIEKQAQSGVLVKLPATAMVCQGSVVSATLMPGNGGNGTDELHYRTRTGNVWSLWHVYSSASNISTSGLAEVEIRTRRLSNHCLPSDEYTVTWLVEPTPFAFAGNNSSVCANNSFALSGAQVSNANGVLWTSSGDGTFSNASALNPTYTPGTNDKLSGLVTLTLTANTNGLCQVQSLMQLSITTAVSPAVTIVANQTTVCQGTPVAFTATAVNGGSNPVFTWKVNGQVAGGNTANFVYTPQQGDVVTAELLSNLACVTQSTALSNPVSVNIVPIALVVQAMPANAGTASFSGSIQQGNTITLSATPFPGFSFTGWTNQFGQSLGNSPEIQITITACYNEFTASFASNASLSGRIKYYNPIESSVINPSSQFMVQLWRNGLPASTAQAINSNGEYHFNGLVTASDYALRVWEQTSDNLLSSTWMWKNWGGVSGLDALILGKMVLEEPLSPFFPWIQPSSTANYTPFAIATADVNRSESLTGSDGLAILLRVAQDPTMLVFPNNRHNFILSAARVNNPNALLYPQAPDMLFEAFGSFQPNTPANTVYHQVNPGTINLGNNYMNIYLSAAGDLNASFVPGAQQKTSAALNYQQLIQAKAGDIVDLPLFVDQNLTLGAITLGLKYNTDLLEVTQLSGLDINTIDRKKGVINAAWYNVNGAVFSPELPLLTLRAKLKQNIAGNTRFMELLPGTEFASEKAAIIEGVQLKTLAIGSELSDEFNALMDHRVMPNPFRDQAKLSFTLPTDGMVTVMVFNQFGQLVKQLNKTALKAGYHTLDIHAADLHHSGTFYYSITHETESKSNTVNGKLILVK